MLRTLATLLLATAFLSGCASSAPKSEIEIKDNEFEGGDRTVAVGAEVEFDNEGNNLHHLLVTGPTPATTVVVEKDLTHEQSIEHTFATAGKYNVTCTLHAGMSMVLTVA